MNREAINQALFDRVKNMTGIQTSSRRLRLASEVSPEEQPALFLIELPEKVQYQKQGLPAKHFLEIAAVIYYRLTDANTIPGSVANPLLDALEAALAPAPDEEDQTLGQLVEYCRIDGDIEKVPGIVGGQGELYIPIHILAL